MTSSKAMELQSENVKLREQLEEAEKERAELRGAVEAMRLMYNLFRETRQ